MSDPPALRVVGQGNESPRNAPIPEQTAAAPHGAVPPQNLEAEEAVLGAMLLSPGAIDAVSGILDPGDFYRDSHAKIYRAAVHLRGKGEPVDAITLTAELEQRGELDQVGGRVRLNELARLVPPTANAARYAEIVRDTATLRGLIRAGGEIAQLGWEREGEPVELVARAERLVAEVAGHTQQDGGLTSARDGFLEAYRRLDDPTVAGHSTGFPGFDRVLGGLKPANLLAIGARPSVGKSSLALQFGWHVAKTAGPVALFSLEMSKVEVAQRLISLIARVDLARLANGRLEDTETKAVAKAMSDAIYQTPFFVDDTPDLRLTDIAARALRQQNQGGLELVIVDYLQLITPARGGRDTRTRNDEVSEISRGLKMLAKRLQVPVLALSQFNREGIGRPTLKNFRDSGSIEQDIDVGILLHRPGADDPENDDGSCEAIVAKNRNGPKALVPLTFVGRSASFTEVQRMPGVVG